MALSTLIEDLKGTARLVEKVEILQEYDSPLLRDLLEFCFHPDKQFNVRIAYQELPPPGELSFEERETEIRELLGKLIGSQSHMVNRGLATAQLRYLDRGSQELLWGVIDKNLHCGLNTKGVLQAFPNLIPETLVQLAHKFHPEKNYLPFGSNFGWSYKLDGIRCTARCSGGRWELISRKGKPIFTANHIIPDLERIRQKTGMTFFDGELYKHGLKFENIQGPVMRISDPTAAQHLQFCVFIAFKIEDFINQTPPREWITQFEPTDTVIPLFRGYTSLVPIREQVSLMEQEGYDSLASHYPDSPLVEAISQGYEGIMLRSVMYPYDYKRSNALMKVKVMDSDDCKVVDVQGDRFPIIENGEHTEIFTLIRIHVKQPNGVLCYVGSGYDIPFREYWWKNKDNLIGRVVEVLHQGYGSDRRMRFPVFSKIREDK